MDIDEPGSKHPSITAGHAILADRIYDGHRWHSEAALLIRDGRIVGLGTWGEVPPDWPQTRLPAGALVAPGFIDLQVNGGGGVLLNDQPTADGMRAIARAHRRFGTTACLPTLITDTREQMRNAIAAGRSIGAGMGSSACTWRAVHQSAAPGRSSAGADRATWRRRPGRIVRSRRRRQVPGDAGARMCAGGLCPDAGFLRCANFDRA